MVEPVTEAERPDPPPLPHIPSVADVPRGVDIEKLAAEVLAAVNVWAPGATAAVDFTGAAEIRRRLVPVVATIYRRNVSKAATLDIQHAARIVDRVCGLTILEGRSRGLIRSRTGKGQNPNAIQLKGIGIASPEAVFRMARPSDEDFAAAVEKGRAAGSLAVEPFTGYLGVEHLTEVEVEQRERLLALAAEGRSSRQIASVIGVTRHRVSELCRRYSIDVPGDTAKGTRRTVTAERILTGAVPQIEGIAAALAHIDESDFEAMDPEDARRWGQELWDALTPVMGVMRQLRARGKGK